MKILLTSLFLALVVAPFFLKKSSSKDTTTYDEGDGDQDNPLEDSQDNPLDELVGVVSETPDIQTQKQGYRQLVDLCLAQDKRVEVMGYIDDLTDHNDGDDDYGTTLNYMMNTLYEMSITLIRAFDWKEAIEEMEWEIRKTLEQNFSVEANLPKADDYGPTASISFPNVFKDYDQAIRRLGFQLSFIDTGSDEYVIVVNKLADAKKVAKAINMIGYRYLHADSPQVN